MMSTVVHAGESHAPAKEHAAGVTIDARVMGCFSVAVNGHRIHEHEWGRVAAERLFKLLLISPGHRVRRDVAGEALWPEMDPEHQAANLRKALHFARQALERHGRVLATHRHEIGLAPSVHLNLDLDQLMAASERIARSGGAPSGNVSSEGDVLLVLRLGALELLPDDLYEEWPAALRETIALRWQTFAVEAARARASAERTAEARELLNSVLSRDPADEDAHSLLSELLAKQGLHYAARRQMNFGRRRSADSLLMPAGPGTI